MSGPITSTTEEAPTAGDTPTAGDAPTAGDLIELLDLIELDVRVATEEECAPAPAVANHRWGRGVVAVQLHEIIDMLREYNRLPEALAHTPRGSALGESILQVLMQFACLRPGEDYEVVDEQWMLLRDAARLHALLMSQPVYDDVVHRRPTSTPSRSVPTHLVPAAAESAPPEAPPPPRPVEPYAVPMAAPSASPPVTVAKVALTFEGSVDGFGAEQQSALLANLASFGGVPVERLRVLSVRAGSIIVEVEVLGGDDGDGDGAAVEFATHLESASLEMLRDVLGDSLRSLPSVESITPVPPPAAAAPPPEAPLAILQLRDVHLRDVQSGEPPSHAPPQSAYALLPPPEAPAGANVAIPIIAPVAPPTIPPLSFAPLSAPPPPLTHPLVDGMSEDEMREAQRMFDKFDVDGDGAISYADFSAAMGKLEPALAADEHALRGMFDAVATDGDVVRLPAFIRMRRQADEPRHRQDEMRQRRVPAPTASATRPNGRAEAAEPPPRPLAVISAAGDSGELPTHEPSLVIATADGSEEARHRAAPASSRDFASSEQAAALRAASAAAPASTGSFAAAVLATYKRACPSGDFMVDDGAWLALLHSVAMRRGFAPPREQLLQLFEAAREDGAPTVDIRRVLAMSSVTRYFGTLQAKAKAEAYKSSARAVPHMPPHVHDHVHVPSHALVPTPPQANAIAGVAPWMPGLMPQHMHGQMHGHIQEQMPQQQIPGQSDTGTESMAAIAAGARIDTSPPTGRPPQARKEANQQPVGAYAPAQMAHYAQPWHYQQQMQHAQHAQQWQQWQQWQQVQRWQAAQAAAAQQPQLPPRTQVQQQPPPPRRDTNPPTSSRPQAGGSSAAANAARSGARSHRFTSFAQRELMSSAEPGRAGGTGGGGGASSAPKDKTPLDLMPTFGMKAAAAILGGPSTLTGGPR